MKDQVSVVNDKNGMHTEQHTATTETNHRDDDEDNLPWSNIPKVHENTYNTASCRSKGEEYVTTQVPGNFGVNEHTNTSNSGLNVNSQTSIDSLIRLNDSIGVEDCRDQSTLFSKRSAH